MNEDQVAEILQAVRRGLPHQQVDKMAMAVWWPLLGDLDFDDAMRATRDLMAAQPFVGPSDIRAAHEAIQQARVQAVGAMPVPQVDPDDLAAYRAEGQAVLHRVLTGQWGRVELAAYERAGRSITGARTLYVNPAVSTSRPALPAGLDLTRSA